MGGGGVAWGVGPEVVLRPGDPEAVGAHVGGGELDRAVEVGDRLQCDGIGDGRSSSLSKNRSLVQPMLDN
jgi:hypothetical protein